MRSIRSTVLVIFWIVALTEIISQFFNGEVIHYVCKPLLLPLMMTAVFLYTWPSKGRQLIITGAFFSFCGDVFLLFQDRQPEFFMGGLACFLMTHVFYSLYFLQVRKNGISLLKEKPYLLLLLVAYTCTLLWLLLPTLGTLKIPVIAYSVVITVMMITCLRAFNFLNEQARLPMLVGAICFVLSDSLLAINKFYHPFSGASALIMLTYCLAQYLILTGFIKNDA